jgi:DNA-binding CsgD family transcriptional regulator
MLLGREAEQQILEGLLHQARAGRSAVLVLRGEPGIGKSALLDYAQANAPDMTVLRCVGIEAEHEFPFAGLHQLLRPCLGLLDRLPEPQAAALRGAFGLSFDRVERPFLVSLAALSLLAEACDQAPVLCLVDDAHWIDRPSQEALAFAARRLEAEPVVLLMASRIRDSGRFGAAGLPELTVHGLAEDPARALLEAGLGQPATAEVMTMLVRTAHGNPLALLELPMALTHRQLRGADPIAGPLRAKGAVLQSFRIRVARLPSGTRRALLLAAAEEGGDLHALQPALERCGLTVSALEAAEDAGLVQVDGAVVFRHPLVRSAVYGSATRPERRAAHQMLAAVLDDPLRSAWHRALAAERADEAIAAELDAAALQAAARGAQATAAAAAERAAELSQQAARKGRRLTYAARASVAAGFSDTALALVDRARPLVTDQVDVAELAAVSAAVSFKHGPPTVTFTLLEDAASALAEAEPERALDIVALMILAAASGAWVADGIAEAHRMLGRIRACGERHEFLRGLLDGGRAVLDGDVALGRKRLSDAMRIEAHLDGDTVMATAAGLFCLWMADYPSARDRFARITAQHRAEGSLTGLAETLLLLAFSEMCVAWLQAGLDAAAEGLELARQLGYENDEISYLALHAWITALLGQEGESRECAAAVMRRGLAVGLGWAPSQAHLALGVLELQLGNAAEAMEHFEQMDPGPLPPTALLNTPEFIDAALRLGEPGKAALALARFAAWAPVSGTPLVNGMLARCRGVMTGDDQQAEELFAEALRHHDHRVPPYERARTQLAYGERLRRSRRRAESRIQLRSALDTFDGAGAVLWAERARAELRATGETARKRDESTLELLTPQELRVARLVAAGSSNKDVAAQLFLSSRTVEYHLGKVFTKLGVASRVELARAALEPSLAGQGR